MQRQGIDGKQACDVFDDAAESHDDCKGQSVECSGLEKALVLRKR